jgi:hypothetical protein
MEEGAFDVQGYALVNLPGGLEKPPKGFFLVFDSGVALLLIEFRICFYRFQTIMTPRVTIRVCLL